MLSIKKRALVFAIFIAVFLISYSIGTTYKLSDEEIRKFVTDYRNSTKGIGWFGIFVHNVSVALPMFIPGAGVGWGTYAAWSTGAGFTALRVVNPTLSSIPPIYILVSTPFGILELVAYSIGMSRSLLLVFSIIKKTGLRVQLVPSAIEIGIVVGLLIIGGLVESSIINTAQ